MLQDLVYKNRSYRRFDQTVSIDRETLRELVDLARCSASGSNRQPLKFVLVCDPETNARVFPHTRCGAFMNITPYEKADLQPVEETNASQDCGE